jgi:peptide/nickel transport system substrate-binding protein
VVRFKLKPGLLWSDGMPLTASDSVFSYRVAISEYTTYSLGGLVSLSAETSMYTANYTAPDDLTAIWTGLPGFLDPTYQANFFVPLPQHVLARFQVDELLTSEDANRMPLGWGPYQLTRWDAGQQIVLERNPNYFRAAEGLPYFDRLVYRFVDQDPGANLSALQSGACDVLLADALPSAPTDAMFALAESGAATLSAVPGPDEAAWELLAFAVGPSPADGRPALFADARLRHAVAFCVDRHALADHLYAGYAPILDSFLPAGHPLLGGAEISAYPYEPAAGMALLDEAGWRDEDGDGRREAHGVAGISDGWPLQLTLTTTEASYRGELGAQLAVSLRACGMDVALVQAPARDLFAQDPQAALTGRHFDLAQYSFPGRWTPPCEIALAASIPSADTYWDGENLSGYANPAYEAACVAASHSLPGEPAYAAALRETLRIFSADLPVLPLFAHVRFVMTRPDLSGMHPAQFQGSEMIPVETFRLAEP